MDLLYVVILATATECVRRLTEVPLEQYPDKKGIAVIHFILVTFPRSKFIK